MFCWGSAGHGELGLGGIEEENIFVPREVDFEKCHEIQQSEMLRYFKNVTCKMFIVILLINKILLNFSYMW